MKTITNLAWSHNRKSNARSVLIMLSIFLTAVLLSVIATFGYLKIRYQRVHAREFMVPITVHIQGSRRNRLQKCRKEVSLTRLVEGPPSERSRMRERCLSYGRNLLRLVLFS